MSQPVTVPVPPPLLRTLAPSAPRYLPLLLILFVGSGCAALIYEVVWFQLLQLVIGSSAVSIGVLLGTFMGGMCLGSLIFHRLISRRFHPLRIYALLELAIGAIALAVTLGMPILDRFYIAYATPGMTPGLGAILFRGLICAICLLPPTLLMGATLPAISRWIDATPSGVAWLGFFYGGNTAGAVVGCLLAGFYLLRIFDMTTAAYVAAAINLFVAAAALSISAAAPRGTPAPGAQASSAAPPDIEHITPATRAIVYAAIALSGLTALGAEVVWTRVLSLLLGGTVYTFSIILAVFLFGLGIGSSLGAMIARGQARPSARLALGWCQLLLACGIAWAAVAINTTLPNWPVNPFIATSAFFNFQVDLLRCMWAILPASILWGASFPLALAALVTAGRDPAGSVGRVYAANTVGAILGALLFSMVFIPGYGSQGSNHILIVLAGFSAVLALLPLADPAPRLDSPAATARSGWGIFASMLAAILVPAILIESLDSYGLDTLPPKLVAWGRTMRMWSATERNDENPTYLCVREGMNSSVAVTQLEDGSRRFHVSGKVEASTLPEDMRLQLMLGHFPALFHKDPESVLIVGCGAGVTAGCFVVHPSVKKIVICEIEPLIPTVVAQYFDQQNNGVVSRDEKGNLLDSRVTIVYDDARHFLLTTKDRFDIITSDPIHPWVKGAATLYTKEYFDLCRQHLNEGGLVTQWVPLYESDEPTVKSEIATFCQSFPDGTIWSNLSNGEGYDVVVMGDKGGAGSPPLTINSDELTAKLRAHVLAAGLLAKSGFNSAEDILSTYSGRAADLAPWLAGAEINYDRNLRLEYLAGASVNAFAAGDIERHILAYRRYPDGLITGSAEPRLRSLFEPTTASSPSTAPATTATSEPATRPIDP